MSAAGPPQAIAPWGERRAATFGGNCTARIAPATPATIAEAAARLRAGELVAFPTETVYGLGGDAGNPDAVRAIFAAKGRPADHPVIVHVADATQLSHWARDVPPGARRLADAFWPGPMTLILPRTAARRRRRHRRPGPRRAARAVASGRARPSAGVRRGRRDAASPRRRPTASGASRRPPRSTWPRTWATRVALIVDGGACDVGIESTIVAFGDGAPMLLRPGGIAAADIARVLGEPLRAPGADAPRASGTLASHYAPRTPMRLAPAPEVAHVGDRAPRSRCSRARSRAPPDSRARGSPHPGTRRATRTTSTPTCARSTPPAPTAIVVEAVPDDAQWQAVRDRLARASRGDTDDRD